MQLLVSVRSAEEATLALAGGAALIDIKEPTRGPLGMADAATITAVIETVAGRCPVSAALGELRDWQPAHALPGGLQYIKWGLAGTAGRGLFLPPSPPVLRGRGDGGEGAALEETCPPTTAAEPLTPVPSPLSTGARGASSPPSPPPYRGREESREGAFTFRTTPPITVLAAYADWQQANAPSLDEVLDFTFLLGCPVLLIDTCDKTPGRTLLDYLSTKQIVNICNQCHEHRIQVALAGALGAGEIRQLLPARPDWFAVRGAACSGRDRTATIDRNRVRELARLLD